MNRTNNRHVSVSPKRLLRYNRPDYLDVFVVKTLASPVRKQYLEVKRRYPDAVLLFRMGDFYETFDEDARILARDVEIVLTQRDMGEGEVVPLAGIPYMRWRATWAVLSARATRWLSVSN